MWFQVNKCDFKWINVILKQKKERKEIIFVHTTYYRPSVYQNNEDDLWFKSKFLPSFQPACDSNHYCIIIMIAIILPDTW